MSVLLGSALGRDLAEHCLPQDAKDFDPHDVSVLSHVVVRSCGFRRISLEPSLGLLPRLVDAATHNIQSDVNGFVITDVPSNPHDRILPNVHTWLLIFHVLIMDMDRDAAIWYRDVTVNNDRWNAALCRVESIGNAPMPSVKTLLRPWRKFRGVGGVTGTSTRNEVFSPP